MAVREEAFWDREEILSRLASGSRKGARWMMSQPTFPAPVKMERGKLWWHLTSIDHWINKSRRRH